MKHRAQASIFYVHTCVVKFTCRFLPCQSFKKKKKPSADSRRECELMGTSLGRLRELLGMNQQGLSIPSSLRAYGFRNLVKPTVYKPLGGRSEIPRTTISPCIPHFTQDE